MRGPTPEVRVFDRQRRLLPPARRLASVARSVLRHGRWRGGTVEVTLVDDRTLRRLHRRFLGDPRPTDVMAFDYRGDPGPSGGEVVVSADRALAESRRRGHALLEEIALYVAHGCLHLCGFRDGTPRQARAMRRAEAEALRRVGIPHRFDRSPPL